MSDLIAFDTNQIFLLKSLQSQDTKDSNRRYISVRLFLFFFIIIIFFTSVLFEYIKVTVNNYSMFCDLLPRIHCNIFAVSFSQNSAACINGLIWNWESLSDALRSTEQCENFRHFKSDSARGFGERSFIAWKLRASRYIQVSFYSQRDLICIQSTFQSNGWPSNLLIRH